MRAAIVLAAGGSRRFGRQDKLLARVGGRPLLLHALANARGARVARVVVVVPSSGGRVARLVGRDAGRPVQMVVARDHRRGMGASLRAGLAALMPIEREAAIFLGDMPDARLPRGLRLRPGHDAARPMQDGVPGHPVLVRTLAARKAVCADDRGLFGRLDPTRVALVRAGEVNAADIDTRAALAKARRLRRGRAE